MYTQSYPNAPSSVIQQSPLVYYAPKKLQNINCIQQAGFGYGGLFLGDIISVMKSDILRQNDISAILSCHIENNINPNISQFIVRKIIPAKDTMDYPLHLHFDQAYEFIESQRVKNKNVLVHCHAGVSRSAALVCAYLMRKYDWKLNQALQFTKQKRERIRPNPNFLNLLSQYEKKRKSQKKIVQKNQNFSFEGQVLYGSSIVQRRDIPDMQSSFSKRASMYCADSRYYYPDQVKSQIHTESTKGTNRKYEKNKVSLKLGRKTRIPWQLLEQREEMNMVKKKLFLPEKEQIPTPGCFS